MHRDLQIADRIDAVGAEVFQELHRCRIAVAHMSGALERDVFREVAILAHFIGNPEHAFVIDQEAAAAKLISTLDVLDSTDELFLATKAISNADTLGRKNRCARIIGRAGPVESKSSQP